MPEEGIETQELKERMEEAHEHAAHGHGHGESSHVGWLVWLSLSTAFLAVFAAIAALESGSNANDAILRKDDAILHQSRADDAWAYYQSKGIQSVIYTTQAEAMPSADLGQKWRASAQKEAEERAIWRGKAEDEERLVEANDVAAERSLHVHHQFASSVTIFQVAIALAAIAALTRRPPMWWVSLGLGVIGAIFFSFGFLPH
jgi:hypothetical protein